MVLIISSEDDQSTNDVIDWLRYFKIKYIRISHLDIINYKNLIVNNNEFDVELLINGLSYKLTEFNFFWYRRSFLNLQLKELEINSPVSYELKKHIYNEAQEIHRIVKRYIEELKKNFRNWKSTFRIKGRPGSIIYRAFIDYLINVASDAYLNGLCENFKR